MPSRPWPIPVDPRNAPADGLHWAQVSRDQALRAASLGLPVAVEDGFSQGASRFDASHPAFLASGPYLYGCFRYFIYRGPAAFPAPLVGPPAGRPRRPVPYPGEEDSEERLPLEVENEPQPPPAPAPARRAAVKTRKQAAEGTLRFDLALDPASEKAQEDTFHLEGLDTAYSQVRTVQDDRVPGDGKLTLVFTGVEPGRRYTLRHRQGGEDIILVPEVRAPADATDAAASPVPATGAPSPDSRPGDVVGMKTVFRECCIRYEKEDLWARKESEYGIELVPITGKWLYVFGGPQGEKPVLIAEGVGISGGRFRPVDLGRHRGKNRRPPIEAAQEWITLPLQVNGRPWDLFACLSPIQLAWKRIGQIGAKPLPRCYRIGEDHGGVCWVPGRIERKAPHLPGIRDARLADPGEDAVVVGLIDPMAEAKRRAAIYQKHVEPFIANRFDLPDGSKGSDRTGEGPAAAGYRRRKYAAGILQMLLETHPDKDRLRLALADRGQGLETFLREESERDISLRKKVDQAGAGLAKWLDSPNGIFEEVLSDYAADPELKEQWEDLEEAFAFLVRHFEVSPLTRQYGNRALSRKDSWVNRCLLNEDFHGAARKVTQASVEILSWLGKVMVSRKTFDLKTLEHAYGLYIPGIRFERRAFSSLEYKSLVADFFPDERVKRPAPEKVRYWEALKGPGYRRETELLWVSKDSLPMRKLAQVADSRLTKALLLGVEGVNIFYAISGSDTDGISEKNWNLIGAGSDFLNLILECVSVFGKQAGRGFLSGLGTISAGIDTYLAFQDANQAQSEGDYEAMISHLTVAAGSASLMLGSAGIAFSIYSTVSLSGNLLTAIFTAGGGLSMTGAGLPVAAILCLGGLVAIAVGSALYPSVEDADLVAWMRKCPWGKEPAWAFEGETAVSEFGILNARLFPWTIHASYDYLFGQNDYQISIQGPLHSSTKITIHALDLFDENNQYSRILQDDVLSLIERKDIQVRLSLETQASVIVSLNAAICHEAHRKRFPSFPNRFKYCRIALTVDQYGDGEILWPGSGPEKALVFRL